MQDFNSIIKKTLKKYKKIIINFLIFYYNKLIFI